jgi:hypothetical protein
VKTFFRSFGRTGLGLLLLAAICLPAQAQTVDPRRPTTPIAGMMWDLAPKMEGLLRRAAQAKSWQPVAAEAKSTVADTAAKIATYLKSTGRIDEVIVADKAGMSPLTQAAVFGFAEILEVFLAYPDVRAHLDEPVQIFDKRPVHLWSIASAAPIHSLSWCGGSYELAVFLSPVSLAYLEAYPDQTPYLQVRTLLEQAGATPQPDEARAVWRFLCRVQARPDQTKDGILLWKDDDGGTFMPPMIPGARDRVLAAPRYASRNPAGTDDPAEDESRG